MFLWKVTGLGLETLYISADSLDDVLAIARTYNKGYNGCQPIA